MAGKNVLVTGANGHVGYTLTRFLAERGYNVRASVRDKNNKELIKNLKDIENGKSKFIEQDHSKATYAKKIDKNETKINWKIDADKVLAHIHGLSPNPGAWFEFDKERFKVLKASVKVGTMTSVLGS